MSLLRSSRLQACLLTARSQMIRASTTMTTVGRASRSSAVRGRASVLPSASAASSSVSFSTSAASTPAAAAAAAAPLGTIPVIDLTGTFGSGPEVAARRAFVAAQIDRACRDIGFFTIVGHGIPKGDIDAVVKATQRYFDQPEASKNLIPMDATYPYGYSGFGGESLSKGYGEAGKPDPKECFAIGPNNPKADMPPVRWPQEPKEFTPQWQQYYASMEGLSAHLLSLFALALRLPEDWFVSKIDRHRSALRALNYPAADKPMAAGEIRAGAHTDYGSLTILLQDAVGGLQVRNRAMQWVDAKPQPHSFVINLGDLMARWSNDRWVSTLHRVVQPASAAAAPPARRQSMAFFHNLNADALIECIPSCTSSTNPPKYPPITAWDLLIEKHLSATTY